MIGATERQFERVTALRGEIFSAHAAAEIGSSLFIATMNL
jgi:hypothetical protein